jgi:hypothetical protein
MNSKDLYNLQEAYTQVYNELDEERAPGVKPYKPSRTQAEIRADEKKAAKKKADAGKDKSGYGPEEKFKSDWKLRATPSSKSKRKDGTEETVSQRMNREKPYVKRMTGQMAREYGSRHAAEVTRVVKGAGEPQAVTYPRKGTKKEDFDMFDLILSHLLDEGYADTQEAAIAIMSNMSEEWRDSIIG